MEQREVSEKSYLPFGVAIGESGSGYGYLGEAYDAVTKTINLHARQYEPELQRFSQKDALVGDPTKPLTLNRYLYVANDSVNYEDPSGLALSSLMKKVATTVKTTAKQVVKKAAMVQTASKVFSVVAGGVVERVTGSKTVQASVKNAISSTAKGNSLYSGKTPTLGKSFTNVIKQGKLTSVKSIFNKLSNACVTAIRQMEKQRDLVKVRNSAVTADPGTLEELLRMLGILGEVVSVGLGTGTAAVALGAAGIVSGFAYLLSSLAGGQVYPEATNTLPAYDYSQESASPARTQVRAEDSNEGLNARPEETTTRRILDPTAEGAQASTVVEGDGGAKAPDRPGSMQREVEKGQAPKDVERVDPPHVEGQKPHVHFKDKTSLNNDGTIHDKGKGIPTPSNKVVEWLEGHGWKGN